MKWTNLWHVFQFAPGTFRPRFLLFLWEISLWLEVFAGGYLCAVHSFWWALLALTAFERHELLFIHYVEKVVKLRQYDYYPYDRPGSQPSYTAALERWTGDYGTDPGNKVSG